MVDGTDERDPAAGPGPRLRAVPTSGLGAADLEGLRALFAAAWPTGRFDEDDFAHAMGGRHWLAEHDGRIISHASVVERALDIDGMRLRTGYLEAVATLPAYERRGYGSAIVRGASEHIRASFELGALSTGRPAFYERLGWLRWLGPTLVRTPDGPIETPEDHGGILVLPTPVTPVLDRTSSITCDWRPGDVW